MVSSRGITASIVLPILLLFALKYKSTLWDFLDSRTYEWFIDDCLQPLSEIEDAGRRSDSLAMIHVVYASEPKRFGGLLTSMVSLARHLEKPHECQIHLIVRKATLLQAEDLISCFRSELGDLQSIPVVTLHELKPLPFNVSHFEYEWSKHWPEGIQLLLSPLSLARLYLHEYLPSATRAIWLDDDTFIKTDIKVLYHIQMRHALAAAYDAKWVTWEKEYRRHLPDLEKYVSDLGSRPLNAGVMVVDLDRWRSDGIAAVLTAWMGICQGRMQLAFNLEFQRRGFDALSWQWNVMGLTLVPPQRCIDQARILHWAGAKKPWHRDLDLRLRTFYSDITKTSTLQHRCDVASFGARRIAVTGDHSTNTGDGLKILAYATPVCASSHQLAIRRVAEALADAGHAVTLLEPWALVDRKGFSKQSGIVTWAVDVMSDDAYDKRFKAGESFQRLSQEVNSQLVSQVLPQLRRQHFDLAVIDALYPLLAKELALPSVHVQCQSDPEALNSVWLHYGLSTDNSLGGIVDRLRFAGLWAISWAAVGSHQDAPDTGRPWAEYYRHQVLNLALQGTHSFTLPSSAYLLAAANPSHVTLVGSITARPTAEVPEEAARLLGTNSTSFALVAFGTHQRGCPLEILKALAQVGLTAIVLVDACRDIAVVPRQHVAPVSKDQAGWLRIRGMRLAVLHGGIHSLLEAVAAGLPVACVPQEGDQWANCRDLQKQGFGWAIHPKAPGPEAAAAFKFILAGNFSKPSVVQQFAKVGGVAAIVRLVDPLVSNLRAGGLQGRALLAPLQPFFAQPFVWPEAWLALASAVFSLLLLIFSCLPPETGSVEPQKPGPKQD